MNTIANAGGAALDRIVALFASLSRDDIARLGDFYAADARFRDPFNDVRDVPAIQRVFTHMFDALEAPRFVVRSVLHQDGRAFIGWDSVFALRRGRAEQTIEGGSLLRLDAEGRIVEHTDYWDASELTARMPVLGAAVRWFKRRAAG